MSGLKGNVRSPGVTFAVHDVAVATKPRHEVDPKHAIEMLSGVPLEACSDYRGTLVPCRFHPLVEATWIAYNEHRPLVLSPDIVWLAVAGGLSAHIGEHSEELRPRFVSHAGTMTLKARRDDFVKGSPENPWGEVIDEFSRQIGEQAGPKHELIVANFSTTGPVERVASEIVLMDAMQNYFRYEMMTACGIPSLTLDGTVEDWEEIRSRVDGLDEFGLSWWTEALRPVVDGFVSAAKGKPDLTFWRSIFKVKGESGGPYLTGWLMNFFPYLVRDELEPAPSYQPTGRRIRYRNPFLKPKESKRSFGGVRAESLPGPVSRAPFRWEYLGRSIDYEFLAGLIGIGQDRATMALRPRIGWAVRPT